MDSKGYIQVYTGDGKGKTTAALGLAFRALGHEMKVFIGQFMKGQDYGELHMAAKLEGLTVEQFGDERLLCMTGEVDDMARELAQKALSRCREVLCEEEYDIVILDELCVALFFGLVDEEQLLELCDMKSKGTELVITGRRAPQSLLDRADLVTEMKEIKHYYTAGVQARCGIER